MRVRHTIFALYALSGMISSTRAQSPGVEIKVQAQPQTATVGDRIQFDFEIVMPKGSELRFPELGNQLGDFTILESHPGPIVTGTPVVSPKPSRPPGAAPADETIHHRARIVAALYRVGKFKFPPIQLIVRDAGGKEVHVSSPSVQVEIQSILTEKDQALKELKRQAEIQEPVRWAFWLALGLLLFLLAFLAWWWWQRRRGLKIPLPSLPRLDPFGQAEAELRDLMGRGLLQKGFVKQFYVILSEIIKKVLEAGYGIKTVEKTTGEIAESLRHVTPAAATADLERIEGFLLACDLVKFAKHIPSKTENDSAVRDAFDILEACKKQGKLEVPLASTPIVETP